MHKRLLKYTQTGTKHYKQTLPAKAVPDLSAYVDSDCAGCPKTKRSTTGLLITLRGTTTSYGSRTQATIALSSAEAELYAINTGAAEAHNKISIKIHTDAP